jgi:hypothetical protein
MARRSMSEIARHYTLTSDDLEIVGRRRGDATRLGYAMLMLYMRWPGRALEAGEVPPAPVLAYVAQQLGVAPAAFADYAHRDQTRREHLVEIRRSHGFRIFDRNAFREVVAFSIPIAQTIIHPGQMAGVIVDELRRRQILLPSRRFSKRCCGGRASKPNSLPMKCSRMACCRHPSGPGRFAGPTTGAGRDMAILAAQCATIAGSAQHPAPDRTARLYPRAGPRSRPCRHDPGFDF